MSFTFSKSFYFFFNLEVLQYIKILQYILNFARAWPVCDIFLRLFIGKNTREVTKIVYNHEVVNKTVCVKSGLGIFVAKTIIRVHLP